MLSNIVFLILIKSDWFFFVTVECLAHIVFRIRSESWVVVVVSRCLLVVLFSTFNSGFNTLIETDSSSFLTSTFKRDTARLAIIINSRITQFLSWCFLSRTSNSRASFRSLARSTLRKISWWILLKLLPRLIRLLLRDLFVSAVLFVKRPDRLNSKAYWLR